ncbi:SwmB domain-containing protein [Azohydromonas lata]|uniref:SwmB domain-containing protein n=1 Tax=Azohydromonas lata TaxID=45677 RepID=UPI00082CAD50|nr:SwmB domain-containing protein [Azohydromonas lata]
MPTNYKWYPGHYVLGAGDTKNLNVLLDGIASTTTATSNIPNLIGVQMRYIWKNLEKPRTDNPAVYEYDFSSILDDLQTLKTRSVAIGRDIYMRILVQFKGIGGRGAPAYLRSGQAGYRSEYGIGVYTWGNAADDAAINEHPALWIPAVEERLALFMEAMGTALDSIGRPAGDIRYLLSTVDFNESSWGTNSGTPLTSTQQQQQKDALLRIQLRTKRKFPTTIVGHFMNFPPYAVNTMCGPMVDNGITLGGPDTWWDDDSVENGVYEKYADAWGKTAISPSIQNQNWEFKKHADVNPPGDAPPIYYIGHLYDAAGNPSLQKIYNRVTGAGVSVDGTFRAGLKGTHVTWQGATWQLHNTGGSLSTLKPWNLIRNFFYDLWSSPGPDYHNRTPGVVTTIPTTLESTTSPPPPPPTGTLTLALTTDTGPVTTDKITNNAGVSVTGASSGATIQYSTTNAGPWTTTPPTPTQGSNTWFVRQVVGGTPGAASAGLTFTYDNDPPDLLQITVNDNVALITYTDALSLTNATGFKAPGSAFTVKQGTSTVAITGSFVNEDLKRVRLDLGASVTAGSTVTVSYAQPTSGTARIQDLAGNYAASFTEVTATNTTGIATPTTTVAISTVGGAASAGYSNSASPAVVGTLSAALVGSERIELQRAPASGVYVTLGMLTATGTAWTYADSGLTEGTYTYRARVRNGDLLGPFSALFTANVDLTPPAAPTASGATVAFGQAATIRGTWSAETGDVLTVSVGSDTYTTANGISVSGTSWSLALPALPPGYYDINARTTDRAGNAALSEEETVLVVLPQPSINHARLAKARRRR